jgi:Fe-S oxidoreductase
VVTFNATHYALKAERVLKKAKYNVKLIPVPRQFSSNCGLALQFNCAARDDVVRIFEEQHVKVHGIHELG